MLETMPTRVAIYGTGAIGCCCAYILSQAGCEVTAICRSNYDAIKSRGITIDSELWGNDLKCRPNVVGSPEEAAKSSEFDYVLVTVKALPDAKVSTAIAPMVMKERTTIVLAQNGIGIEDEFVKAFPESTVLSCVVLFPAQQIQPGHVVGVWFEKLEVGTFPSGAYTSSTKDKEATDLWVKLWRQGGGNSEFHNDIQERRWAKLLMNASWSPIAALSRCRDTAFLGLGEDAIALFRSVQDEIIAISKALGYDAADRALADSHVKLSMDRLGTEGTEPSMLTDVVQSRRTEYQVILGNPVLIAKELGIPVPRLETLHVLMKALDASITKGSPGASLLGTQM